ncbi:MAG: glycine cleavage system aminomethyltransferase GcvT [Armatimonadetes bacterium]|nr:glycine cleavage system aminomethyltransferase GcvT [Armatimonadota bacterium]
MRDTPLTKLHEEAGAKLVEFAGWRLPVVFSSIGDEVTACRHTAALFDISHMGLVRILGREAASAASALLTRDISAIPVNCADYALLCNDNGGILDDLFVYVESPHAIRLVVNAVNHEEDVAWISQRLDADGEAAAEDLRGLTFGIAVQGPRAPELLIAAHFEGRMPMFFGAFFHGKLAGEDVLLSRTGYTGEDGFEVFGAAQAAKTVYRSLTEAARDYSAVWAGLGARDVLRQEMGYPLWGQDLDKSTTPREAGLGWAVDWNHDFIGAVAMRQATPTRTRFGFRLRGPGVARAGAAVFAGETQIGTVTSGTYSHNLRAAIGQGYVDVAANPDPADKIEIDVRGRRLEALVHSLPFFEKRTRPSWRRFEERQER